ncbi:hypothetical protein D3C72_2370500 [compost metagenome]
MINLAAVARSACASCSMFGSNPQLMRKCACVVYPSTSSPASCAASAMAVKLTWAVMSFKPTATSGSPSAKWPWWHMTVPMWRWGW